MSNNIGRKEGGILWIYVEHPVMPYTRQTQRSKYANPRAQAYNANKDATGFLVSQLMQYVGIEPFPKGVDLAFGCTISLAPQMEHYITQTGKHAQRTVHPAWRCDLSNLEKSLEDAMNGILYHDDKQIVERLPGRKLETAKDYFYIEVMEQDRSAD